MQGKKILLLGGGGFIGGALAQYYCENNELTIVDACDFNLSALQYRGILNHPNIKLVRMDATDLNKVTALGEDFDYIIHAVAILGIHKVVEQSVLTISTNYNSCYAALELASHQRNLQKFMTFSTSEAYGRDIEQAEEMLDFRVGPPCEARWCYAASKVLCEHLTNAYYREKGVPTVIIRPFNVFGRFRFGSNAMSKFIASALEGKPIIVDGTGRQIRAWCYIDDFIQGITKALESGYNGEYFNIGNPQNEISILDLAGKIVELLGSSSDIQVSGHQEPDVVRRTLQIEKAQRMLGYEPKVGLAEGIEYTASWMKQLNAKELERFY